MVRLKIEIDDNKEILVILKHGWHLKSIMNAVLLACLKFHDYNRTHTAKALGMTQRNLRGKVQLLRKHGITVADFDFSKRKPPVKTGAPKHSKWGAPIRD